MNLSLSGDTKKEKIFIAGHNGMVGSAILRACNKAGCQNLVTANKDQLNLLDKDRVFGFLQSEKPDVVVIAAARVGGINANIERPADFLYENLEIQNNLIYGSLASKVKKVIFLSSSCIYPKESPQLIHEDFLLTGQLEPTNEGYALAKIAGMKLLEYCHKQYQLDYLTLIPCNLYGPNDSFDLQHSHVLSALIKRFSDAIATGVDQITLWGSGIAKREFLHVDDVADAVLYFHSRGVKNTAVNIGAGKDISIKELSEKIAAKLKFKGSTSWDTTKPDGMLRKCLDVTKMIHYGFNPRISLDAGIDQMIAIYKEKLCKV